MLTRIIDHARGAIAGAILATLILGLIAAPHIQWRLKAGNVPESIASAVDQATALAGTLPPASLPAQKTQFPRGVK